MLKNKRCLLCLYAFGSMNFQHRRLRMHYLPVTRRVILGTAIALFAIVSLVYQSSFGLSSTLVSSSATSAACQVWPSCQGSSPKQLRYEDCRGISKSPQVGDVNSLGSPLHCLLASSRLDQYHSASGRNWTEVRWGKSIALSIASRCFLAF